MHGRTSCLAPQLVVVCVCVCVCGGVCVWRCVRVASPHQLAPHASTATKPSLHKQQASPQPALSPTRMGVVDLRRPHRQRRKWKPPWQRQAKPAPTACTSSLRMCATCLSRGAPGDCTSCACMLACHARSVAYACVCVCVCVAVWLCVCVSVCVAVCVAVSHAAELLPCGW